MEVIYMERLQKVIANSGYASRRKAEELITKGQVKVNNEIVTTLGTKVEERDTITINGEVLGKEIKEYVLLNKPCLSLIDVSKAYDHLLSFNNGNSMRLRNLVKSRL